jgi:carboxylesterase
MTEKIAKQPVIGALLIHGLNGSQHDFAEMEPYFQAQGIVTHTILLPGHGTHVRDLIPIGWSDWATAVRQELVELKQRSEITFVVGHCLGAALALHAAAHEAVDGIVAMCPPLHMYPWIKWGVPVVRRLTPVLPTIREDIRNSKARRGYTGRVYRWTALAPAESLLQYLPRLETELPGITAPALVISSQWDHVIPASDGRKVFQLLGSQDKDLLIVRRSYHVIMKDYDHEEVRERAANFILHHAGTKAQKLAS